MRDRRWKISEAYESIRRKSQDIDTIKDYANKVKEFIMIVKKHGYSIEGLEKYREEIRNNELDVSLWKGLLNYVMINAVKLILNLNCDEYIGIEKGYVPSPEVFRQLDANVKNILAKLHEQDSIIKYQICVGVLGNSSKFNDLIRFIEDVIKSFEEFYRGFDEKIRMECRDKLVSVIDNAIRKAKEVVYKNLVKEISLDTFNNFISSTSLTGTATRLLFEEISNLPEPVFDLIPNIKKYAEEMHSIVESCKVFSSVDKIREDYNNIINSVHKATGFLKNVLEKHKRNLNYAKKLDEIESKLKKDQSLQGLIEALRIVKEGLKMIEDIDFIVMIMKHIREGKATLSDIYKGFPEDKRLEYLDLLIKLCDEGVFACTVSLP
jgi:uncharacterized protein YaaR (DUF327 family)